MRRKILQLGLLLSLMLSLGLWQIQSLKAAERVDYIMGAVYGSISTACTQDADADNGEANPVAMAAGARYVVYCHDGAGTYVSCECLQGISTVDASSAVGILITSPKVFAQRTPNTHISCEPFVANQYIDVCPLD